MAENIFITIGSFKTNQSSLTRKMDRANFSQQLRESEFRCKISMCKTPNTMLENACRKSPDSFKTVGFFRMTDSFREDWYQVSVYRTIGPLVHFSDPSD